MRLGWQEIILIVLIVVILFGARRIPEIMRGLGLGVREFKAGLKDEKSETPVDKPGEERRGEEKK